jgi:uncharacterized hydrophobic protein (TIGR00271 family)
MPMGQEGSEPFVIVCLQMIEVEVFGPTTGMNAVAGRLHELDGVQRVRIQPAVRAEHSMVMAKVSHDAVDLVLSELRQLDVPRDDITMTRIDELGGGAAAASDGTVIWADVVGLAGSNARLIGRYIAFMAVAGVVASYGVIDTNPILIVGAMAVSPDLLPITAAAVGLIGRRPRLVGRAILTLVVGMLVASAFAALSAFLQNQLSLLPEGFSLTAGVLHGLVTVGNETIVVAFVAGIAGMLAFETRASTGVGVAISVTTIPAAAYLGVAFGLGEASTGWGAVAVLATNVALILAGAAMTLAIQRLLTREHPQRDARPPATTDAH